MYVAKPLLFRRVRGAACAGARRARDPADPTLGDETRGARLLRRKSRAADAGRQRRLSRGLSFDTREKSGTANMTADMLRLGAGGMDEDEISRRLADVGAQLAGRFDPMAPVPVYARSPARTSGDKALEILGRPSLSRSSRRNVPRARKSADDRCSKKRTRSPTRLPCVIRSPGLPHASVWTAQRQSRWTGSAAHPGRLVAFYRGHYVAERAVVAMTGDVSREEAAAIAESLTVGCLQRGRALPSAARRRSRPSRKKECGGTRHRASHGHV